MCISSVGGCVFWMVCCFFVKQKTAYEMRISDWRSDVCSSDLSVLIIGSGFSGLGLAVRLKQAGIENFEILERADNVGGTWRDNRYPGCACDVQSHLYSFSFEQNPDWTRM